MHQGHAGGNTGHPELRGREGWFDQMKGRAHLSVAFMEVKGACIEVEAHFALLVLSACFKVKAETNMLILSLTLSPPASSFCNERTQD